MIFVRPFSSWTEDNNVSVPADTVGLILAGGLYILVVVLLCRQSICWEVFRWRRSEEEATDTEVQEEQKAQWDEAPKVQKGCNEGIRTKPEKNTIEIFSKLIIHLNITLAR